MNVHLVIAGAGFLAGSMNSIAGGGSFVTLPALLYGGITPVHANASSSVALYPGSLASTWVYRHDLGGVAGVSLRSLTLASLLGGLAGAILLLATPARLFDMALPWLLLVALLALAFGPRLMARFRSDLEANSRTILAAQALLGCYGGYFGGAVGLMMLAFWSITTSMDAKRLQAPRMFLATAANTAALFIFAAMRVVEWQAVLVLAPAAVAGGYFGARIAASLSAHGVRAATLALATLVTLAFFVRAYA